MKKRRGFVILFFMVIAIAVVSCGGGGGGGGGSSPTGTSSANTPTNTNNPVYIPVAPAGFVTVIGSTVTGGDKFKVGSKTGCFVEGRTVTIDTFFMCEHEVTQAEFEVVMGINPSLGDDNAADGETQGNRPVEMVNWYDAITYCNKKSIVDGLTPCYSVSGITDWANLAYGSIPTSINATWDAVTCNFNANGYRLPTEVEWEYAARGGASGVSATDPTDYAGTNDSASLGSYAWYRGNSDIKTHEVKKKAANDLGLFDMTGNVCEWCWDWYGYWPYTISSSTPANGPDSGSNRVSHEGSYYTDAIYCYVVNLYGCPRDTRDYEQGFRVCRSAN